MWPVKGLNIKETYPPGSPALQGGELHKLKGTPGKQDVPFFLP